MFIYTNLYKTCVHNFNAISNILGLPDIDPPSYEEFCESVLHHDASIISGPMLNKNHSKESKKLISIGNRGLKRTDETKKNISTALLASPNARVKNQDGCLNPMFNKKHSDETKKKMSEKRKGQSSPSIGKKWKRSTAAGKKQSSTITGRKRFYKPDGSWAWIYPIKT